MTVNPGSQIPKASSSPRGPCQRFLTASLATMDASSTIGSAGLYGPNSRVACAATWTCYRTFYSRSHLKLVAFQVVWYTGWSNTPRGGTAVMDVNRPTSHCTSSLVAGQAGETTQKEYLWMPHTPRNFTEVEGPWFWFWIFSHCFMQISYLHIFTCNLYAG